MHATPSDVAVYPAEHLQSVISPLPDTELVLAGHVEHSPAPTALLNDPVSHAMHTAPSDVPLYPAKH